MSSQDGPSEDRAGYLGKKRKTSQRVCDSCRRKKIGCDGPRMPTNKCSRCVSRGIECTFYGGNVTSQYPEGYVESLETRIQRMEELFNKIGPAAELSGAFDKEKESRAFKPMASAVNDRRSSFTAESSAFRQSPPALRRSPGPTSSSSPSSQADDDYGDPDSALTREIVQKISDLSLDPTAVRYWGKSSGFTFIQTAMGMREKFLSEVMPLAERETITPVTLMGEKLPYPWLEVASAEEPIAPQDIPPSDLIPSLVEAYFRKANDVFPVLHEPTFRAGIADNLHLREAGFGCTVLLVCALGARYSSDTRVLVDGTDLYQSAGWKWFKAVDDRHKSSLSPPDLYEVQTCILKATYLYGSSTPQMAWTHVGMGMRRAVEFGAHRNSMYSPTPTVQDELWRRAFWALVLLDWSSSYVFGRPPCIHDEDFDVALPTECDDEYWTTPDPGEAFKQPAGKPSRTTYFIEYIELTRVLAHINRTIFALEKSKAHLRNNTPEWEERVVAELDSKLNQWLDRVPQHLRWDPDREDEIFYAQSASLYTYYYQVQISVHRAFVASHRGHTLALASLIVCTNAARSCVRMLEQVTQRLGDPIPRHAATLCLAGLVLTMSMWSQRRANHTAGVKRDIEYIESIIRMLGLIVRGNNAAEGYKEMIKKLSSIDRLALPPTPSSQDARVQSASQHTGNQQPCDTPSPHASAHSDQSQASASSPPISRETSGSVSADYASSVPQASPSSGYRRDQSTWEQQPARLQQLAAAYPAHAQWHAPKATEAYPGSLEAADAALPGQSTFVMGSSTLPVYYPHHTETAPAFPHTASAAHPANSPQMRRSVTSTMTSYPTPPHSSPGYSSDPRPSTAHSADSRPSTAYLHDPRPVAASQDVALYTVYPNSTAPTPPYPSHPDPMPGYAHIRDAAPAAYPHAVRAAPTYSLNTLSTTHAFPHDGSTPRTYPPSSITRTARPYGIPGAQAAPGFPGSFSSATSLGVQGGGSETGHRADVQLSGGDVSNDTSDAMWTEPPESTRWEEWQAYYNSVYATGQSYRSPGT